jgi:hypothetical protein
VRNYPSPGFKEVIKAIYLIEISFIAVCQSFEPMNKGVPRGRGDGGKF